MSAQVPSYWIVLGVRHQNTPLALREKLSIPAEEVPRVYALLAQHPVIRSACLLSTCNRTELYAQVTHTVKGVRALRKMFEDYAGIDLNRHPGQTFLLLHQAVIGHLFRVASGLDSMVLGEGQILGQVKQAWQELQTHRSLFSDDSVLMSHLFKTAITVGKRVRHETGLAQRDTSMSQASVAYVLSQNPQALHQPTVVLGGGSVATLLLKTLAEYGFSNVTLFNRSQDRLNELCQQYQRVGMPWEEMPLCLAQASTVFVATGAPYVVLTADTYPKLEQPQLIIDLAVPRNVDDALAQHPHVTLLDVDTLGGAQAEQAEGFGGLESAVFQQAQALVAQEVQSFLHWQKTQAVVPTLSRFREKAEQVRTAQLSQQEALVSLDQFSRQLVNRLLHEPTLQIKQAAAQSPQLQQQLTQTLAQLFQL